MCSWWGGMKGTRFTPLQCFSWLKLNFTTVSYFTTRPNFSNFRRELCQTLYTIHNEIGAVSVCVGHRQAANRHKRVTT